MKLSPGLLFNGERLECKLERGVMKMAKLRKMLIHPGKNESGQGALAMVLLLLMLGAVILTPLLVFMSTGVKAGQVYESKLQEFYAADAGVEDAIWEINNGTSGAAYFLGEEVNDRNVSVTIEPISGGGYSGYKIISTATSDTGGNTTIECYYGALDYSSLLDNAITSNGTVCIRGDVNGSVVAEDCTQPGCDNPNCTALDDLEDPIIWPTAETLSEYYWKQVKDFPYSDGDIDVSDPSIALGAWYTEPPYTQGVFDIYNKDSGTVVNATLNGTVYVTDDPSTQYDLQIGQDPHDFTLNLSNQTIFCEGGIEVGGKCTISGSGCIIAVGDVYFAPDGEVGGPGDFVFIMSVGGTVYLQPSGNFYGAIAGDVQVIQRPGLNPDITWIGYGEGIDFPIGQGVKKVLSYTIK